MILLCATESNAIIDGIAIGGAGGAIAGIAIWLLNLTQNGIMNGVHKKRVYNWMKEKTEDETGKRFRSTRAIASWNNLTEDRVRYICSTHKKVYLSTGPKEDMWGIHGRDEDNITSDNNVFFK